MGDAISKLADYNANWNAERRQAALDANVDTVAAGKKLASQFLEKGGDDIKFAGPVQAAAFVNDLEDRGELDRLKTDMAGSLALEALGDRPSKASPADAVDAVKRARTTLEKLYEMTQPIAATKTADPAKQLAARQMHAAPQMGLRVFSLPT